MKHELRGTTLQGPTNPVLATHFRAWRKFSLHMPARGIKNPWIGSSLVKDPKKHGKLVVMRCKSDFPIDEVFEINKTLKINEKMPFTDICKEVANSKAHIPNGYTLLKSAQPVSKLTVIPGSGSFVIIFSMSHDSFGLAPLEIDPLNSKKGALDSNQKGEKFGVL